MALNDTQGWVTQFETMLRVQHSQGSILMQYLDPMNVKNGVRGHIVEFNRTAPVVAPDMVNPSATVVPLNPPRSIRAALLVETQAPVHIYDADLVRSLVDPTNSYTRLMLDALGRRIDTHLLAAATGAATTVSVTAGSGVKTYGTQALPAGQILGTGAAIANLNVLSANELLSKMGNPIGPGQRVWVYAPGQERDLMSITQAISSDFTRNQILDRGTINGVEWEGFRWVMMTDVMDYDGTALLRMLALSGTTRQNVIFARGGLGIASGQDIKTDIDVLPNLQGRPTQVSPKMSKGATRIFDYAVIRFDALEN